MPHESGAGPEPGTPGPGTPGTHPGDCGQLSAEIQDCVFELTGRIIGQVERIAQRLAVPAMFIKALHVLDAPMPMKDLGKRLHCDPSFVTAVADLLEKRGLARRTAHPADRRVKHLVLTGEGCDLKQRLEAELSARMPWNSGLTDDERAQLLALIRKMLSASPPAGDAGPGCAEPGGLAAAGLAGDPPAPGAAATTGSPSRPVPAEGVESSLDAERAAR
jgi:DNA-binding MarR family transcriptional regulator